MKIHTTENVRLQAEVRRCSRQSLYINLNIEGKIIKRVDHAKSLGLYIEKKFELE